MYNGKRVNRKTAGFKRKTVLLVSLLLILTMGISGTLAWLMATDDPEVNVFTPGYVPNEIKENFNNTVKEDVAVKNTGNVNAFVRVAVVATWQKIEVGENGEYVKDENGNYVSTGELAPVAPVFGTDYTWEKVSSKWFAHDGYYYYTDAVPAGEKTEDLFTGCKLKEGVTPPDGYTLVVEILAQTIQAEGVRASDQMHPVEIAWKVAYNDATGTIAAPAAS